MELATPSLNRFPDQSKMKTVEYSEAAAGLAPEDLLNFLLLIYLIMNGAFHGIGKVPNYVVVSLYWAGTMFGFMRIRARIHWELWTCRFAFVFLMYMVASVTWGTQSLVVTLVPTITEVCTFLYYNYLLERYTVEDLLRIISRASLVLVFLSLVAAIIAPGYAIDDGSNDPQNYGAWQGVFVQKNQLGIATALSTAVALALKSRTLLDRVFNWLLMILAITCSIKAQSRESWLAILLQVMALVFMRVLQRFVSRARIFLIMTAIALSVMVTSLIYFNLDAVFAFLGRSPSASGRTDIWADCLILIERRPWLGYGTFGVWHTAYAWDVVAREGWDVTSSHNNYMEIVLDYGLIGLALFLPIVLTSFRYMYRTLVSDRLHESEGLIYIMIAILLGSFAAPLTMYTPAIGMLLLLYCVSKLEEVR